MNNVHFVQIQYIFAIYITFMSIYHISFSFSFSTLYNKSVEIRYFNE